MIKTDPITDEIIYPSSDGKRMAENTKQFDLIVYLKLGIDNLFPKNENVFVASDLLWYPVQGRPDICTAPDVMVALGRPQGDRMSYQQWKEADIAPQVVFEILSPSNTPSEMNKKLLFYDRYGVQEYYVYDPDNVEFFAYLRTEKRLVVVQENLQGFKSPLLGIEFEIENEQLKAYYANGFPFLTFREISESREREYQERIKAEQALLLSEQALLLSEQERNELLVEKQRLMDLLKNAGIKID
jgi:Uma2 family endonuclease